VPGTHGGRDFKKKIGTPKGIISGLVIIFLDGILFIPYGKNYFAPKLGQMTSWEIFL
jgi:hypothetical protein